MSATLVSSLSASVAETHFDNSILEEYCLGMLSSEKTAQVEEHIIGCPHCAERMELEDQWTRCFKAILEYGIPTPAKFFHATA